MGSLTNKKATISGPYLEIKEYSEPIFYGYEKTEPEIKALKKKSRDPEKNKDSKRIDYRVKARVRKLIQCNAYKYTNSEKQEQYIPVFSTFTFKDNVKDIPEAQRIFKNFVQRLNYSVTGSKKASLKYLAVIEFQKRGAIHFHACFFNLRYISYDTIKLLWRKNNPYGGTANIKLVNNLQHCANYVTKYVTKETRDSRLFGKKKYFCSKNLFQPIEIRNERDIDILVADIPVDYPFEFKEYTTKMGIEVKYKCYKFPDGFEVLKDLSPVFSVFGSYKRKEKREINNYEEIQTELSY